MATISIPTACSDGSYRGRYPYGTCANPTFSPVQGTYGVTQLVTLRCATPNAFIHYTVGAVTPTLASPLYNGSITVTASEQINAIAISNGYQQSPVVSGQFNISPPPLVMITSTSPLPSATQNILYTYTLAMSGGVGPFVWTLTSQSAGVNVVSISSNGVVTMAPATIETDTFTVKVTDMGTSPTSSASATFSIQVNAPVVTNTVAKKWPTQGFCGMLSVNTDGWPTNITAANGVTGSGQNAAEIVKIIASIKASPSIWGWYAPVYTWYGCDAGNNAQNYAGIAADAQAVWTAAAQAGVICGFYPMFKSYANFNGAFVYNAGSSVVPPDVYAGSQFGASIPGGSGHGWTFGQYISGVYGYVHARLDNANTNARFVQAKTNLASTVITAINGPWAGIPYTFNKHPGIIAIGDYTDADPNMNGNPTCASDWSYANWNTQRELDLATAAPLWPNTPYSIAGGFGPNSTSGSGDVTAQLALINSAVASGGGVSASDILFELGVNHYSYVQRYMLGQVYNATTATWSANGVGPVYTGKVYYSPQVQGFDYHYGAGGPAPAYSAAQIQGLLQNAIQQGAQLLPFASDDGYAPNGGNAWAGNNTYGPSGIAGVIQAAGGIPLANQAVPLNFLYPLTGLSGSSTQTTATVTWTAGGYPGLTYVVTRSGTVISPMTGVSGTSFTDVGPLNPNTLYFYTVAMKNGNGIGPQSALFNITTAAATGPINVQLLLQGQTAQGQAAFDNPTPQGQNYTMIGFFGTADSFNIYRAVIPIGSQATGTLNYSEYDSISGSAAAALYAGYVSGSGSWDHQISTPGAANAVNCAYADVNATNCVGVAVGSTPGDLYVGIGYSYKVSAVISGAESALSAPHYAVYVGNGLRIACQDVFNNEPVWNSTTGGTTPSGATATLQMVPGNPYINPFCGAGVMDSNFNVRAFNYIEMDIKVDTAGAVIVEGAENRGDILIVPSAGNAPLNFSAYGTLVPGQYVHFKIPLSVVMTDYQRGRQNAWYKWTMSQQNGAAGNIWIDNWKFTT